MTSSEEDDSKENSHFMNTEAITALIDTNPKLKPYREKLEQMKPGNYCVHRSWGFGEIKDYDAVENRLIIDFEDGKSGHAMDPAFCVDKLDVLQPDHILVRSHTEPQSVQELLKKEPVEVIIEILSQYPENSATTTEIERMLARLIGPQKYKKWWSATKKLLIRDPRVGVPQKKTDPYVFRDEPIKPEEEIFEQYTATKNPKTKILLAEKLFDLSDGKSEIKEELPFILETLTECIRDAKSLTMADRLHGVWVRNNLARDLHEDVEMLQPTSASILDATDDLSKLVSDLPTNYYKRLLDLITRTYPDRWEEIIEELLRKSEGKFTSESINFFIERGQEERVGKCFRRWLDEQTIRGPVLYWMVKNRQSKKYRQFIEPLLDERLLAAIFLAIDNEALHSTGTRRIPLADLIADDHELIPDLLASASEETARDLAQTLMMNQGFEDLSKKSVLARFIKIHPSIQSLLASEASTSSQQESLIVSQASFDHAKAEYEELITKKIPENKEAISTAREHGDLRENAEYKMARQDQDALLSRKSQLELDLSRAKVTDFKDAPDKVVGVGSVVDLTQSGSGRSVTYAILGAWDSNPERNILSYQTPLGKELIGKKVGERARPVVDGQAQEFTIEGIRRWIDVQDQF